MATDQEIRDRGIKFLTKQQYLQSPYQFNEPVVEEEEVTESFGIPNTNAFTNSDGNNSTGYDFGNTGFQQAVDARQERLNTPIDTSTFRGKAQSFLTPQSSQSIIEDGYQEPRFQPGIIGTMLGKIDNYRNLPRADQAFISSQMGYTGPTIFGENNSGLGKDEFGINTRSLFGNYAEYVEKQNAKTNKAGVAVKDMTEEEFNDYLETISGKIQKQKAIGYRRKGVILDDDKKAVFDDAKAEQNQGIASQLGGPDGMSGGSYAGGASFASANPYGGDGTEDDLGADNFADYAKGGRAGYFFGGRVNYKTGGEIEGPGDTGGEGGENPQDQSNTQFGGERDGDNNNNPPPVSNDNNVVTTDFISKKPSLTIDYTDPKNYASIYSKMGFNNLLDNDDLTVEGNFATNMGPVTTNTEFTDDGIGNTDINYNNFSTTIDPNKNIKNIGYNNSYNGINYGVNYADGNTMFNVGTAFKNGGLASGIVKPKRGLVDEPGSYAGKKNDQSIGEKILDNAYFMRNERLAGKDDGRYDIKNIIDRFSEGIELPEKISDEGREDLSSVKEIFQEDSPYTEDAFGSSEGFTLSPLTLIRRYFAEQELKRKKGLANGGRAMFKNGGLASIL